MRIDLDHQVVAEIAYCLEVARWSSQVYENERFTKAVNEVIAKFREAAVTADGAWLHPDIEPRLADLAHRRHQDSTESRWVQVDQAHAALLQKAAGMISGAIDASPDSTAVSLGISQMIQRWEDAPSVCPKEASCSSFPSCPCAGGIPV